MWSDCAILSLDLLECCSLENSGSTLHTLCVAPSLANITEGKNNLLMCAYVVDGLYVRHGSHALCILVTIGGTFPKCML